ncbi:MAG: hypothetical protein WD232_06720 [Acidimicrobiales bacterium]
MEHHTSTTPPGAAQPKGPFGRLALAAGKLGGKLGIGIALLGFLVIFLGWNGAASFNDLRQQFPYLISGGLAGLGFVTIGAALLIVENSRKERAELIAAVTALTAAVESMGTPAVAGGAPRTAAAPPMLLGVAPGQVVAGASSFHRPECRLVEGRTELRVMDVDDAEADGLAPCRVCEPTDRALVTSAVADDEASSRPRRQLRAR